MRRPARCEGMCCCRRYTLVVNMKRLRWKEGLVLSVETRHGVFTLAQMSREPYMFFFDVFSAGSPWEPSALEGGGVLSASP